MRNIKMKNKNIFKNIRRQVKAKQTITRTLVITLMLMAAATFFVIMIPEKIEATGENWWNVSWNNRKPVNTNVSDSSLVPYTEKNYTVEMNISYITGMQNDFDDLRFISYSDNTTEYDYWLDQGRQSDGNYITAYVEMRDNITTVNKTHCWMYYNNTQVSTTSNGTNTFVWFDDFETGAFNPDWALTGDWQVTAYSPAVGSYAAGYTSADVNTDMRYNDSGTLSIGNFIVEGFFKRNSTDAGHTLGLCTAPPGANTVAYMRATAFMWYDGSYHEYSSTITLEAHVWYAVRIIINVSNKGSIFAGGGSFDNLTDCGETTMTQAQESAFVVSGDDNDDDDWADELRYMKYHDTEPTYWIGTEEAAGESATVFTIKGLPNDIITWSGTAGTSVFCNSSGDTNEWLETNMSINATTNVSELRVWIGDINNSGSTAYINASNITMYVSSDNSSYGEMGTFTDGGSNCSNAINATNWNAGTMGNDPFAGAGLINKTASIFLTFKLAIPATAATDTFWSVTSTSWKIYLGYT